MDNSEIIFAMYFSSIAGWQFHPGSGHGESKVLTPVQAAEYADIMLAIHRAYFPIKEV